MGGTVIGGAALLALVHGPVAAVDAQVVERLADINPGLADSFPDELTGVNGIVFFAAEDVVAGRELWKTDGTGPGTGLFANIHPDAGADSFPSNLTIVGDTLFFGAGHPTTGRELWKTDGIAGATLVADIVDLAPSSNPADLTAVGGLPYFTADDVAHGRELWRSDGTEAGTVLVKDIVPGAADSTPDDLAVVNGLLFFAALDPAAGTELWGTDGTEAGTVLIANVKPGPFDSDPSDLTAIGGTLFFVADDGITGRELWRTTPVASPVPRLDLALNQTSFVGGNTLVLTATLVPGLASAVPVVDAYIVLEADGAFLSLRPDGSLAPGIAPVATGFTPGVFSGEAFSVVVPPGLPATAASFKAALVHAGGTAVPIGPIDDESFSVGP